MSDLREKTADTPASTTSVYPEETDSLATSQPVSPKKIDLEEEHVRPKAPPASNESVRKSMQGNKRRDTKPELLVRHMLREMGYPGYRLDWKKAHGHPDIAYPGRKIAIYVMGCFWHQHEGCKYASTPKKHAEYWEAKFARNKARDAEVREAMLADGWHVVEIWECELKKDKLEETRERLRREIRYAFVDLQ